MTEGNGRKDRLKINSDDLFSRKIVNNISRKTAAKNPKLGDNTALKIHPIMFCQD